MDNIPNWEKGALTHIRDFVRELRNELSRSRTQSIEDPDLTAADRELHSDPHSWQLPSTEEQYGNALIHLKNYLGRLQRNEAQFFARPDNLLEWLELTSNRLGDLTQRLSASEGQLQIHQTASKDPTALLPYRRADDYDIKPLTISYRPTLKQGWTLRYASVTPAAQIPLPQANSNILERVIKTPWRQVDDIFYEARGATWILSHLFQGIEFDFRQIVDEKRAKVNLRHIIHELEKTQDTLWSPVVLNGAGLGLLSNHSMHMSSHISRANTALIEMIRLLKEG
jgi:hypothetical protein